MDCLAGEFATTGALWQNAAALETFIAASPATPVPWLRPLARFATPEAVFVSKVDDLDARMGMVQRALRQAQETDEFSERLPGLSTSLLTKPVPPAE